MRVFSPGPKYLAVMKVESFSVRVSKLVETRDHQVVMIFGVFTRVFNHFHKTL